MIFGSDPAANLYWELGSENDTHALIALDQDTLTSRFSDTLNRRSFISPTLAYDPIRQQIYVGHLTSAKLEIYTLGSIP